MKFSTAAVDHSTGAASPLPFYLANTDGCSGERKAFLSRWNQLMTRVYNTKMYYVQEEEDQFRLSSQLKRLEEAAKNVQPQFKQGGNELMKEDSIALGMDLAEAAFQEDGFVYAMKYTGAVNQRNNRVYPRYDEETSSLWGSNRYPFLCSSTNPDEGKSGRRFEKDELQWLNEQSGTHVVDEPNNQHDSSKLPYKFFPLGGYGNESKIGGDPHAFYLESWITFVFNVFFFDKGTLHQAMNRNYNCAVLDEGGTQDKFHGVGAIIVYPKKCNHVAIQQHYLKNDRYFTGERSSLLVPPETKRYRLVTVRDAGYNMNPSTDRLRISNDQRWENMFYLCLEYMVEIGYTSESGEPFVVHFNAEQRQKYGDYLYEWWAKQIGYRDITTQARGVRKAILSDAGFSFDIQAVRATLNDKATVDATSEKSEFVLALLNKRNGKRKSSG